MARHHRRPGRPRSEAFSSARGTVDKAMHNAVVEQKKRDHDVNSVRKLLIELLSEEDVDPGLAVEAAMSVAAQIFMLPPPGMKKRGAFRFARLAWRSFRRTQLVDDAA